jgi:SAM-dependent methyltransferase
MEKPFEPYSLSQTADDFERDYVRPSEGRTLIVGSKVYGGRPDRRSLFPDAIGVDMLPGDGVDFVANLESQDVSARLGMFDHIECTSVLEHSRKPWKLSANLERMLKPEGSLYLSVPFVWRVHAYPNDYFRFTAEGVRVLFPRVGWLSLLYGFRDRLYPKPVSRLYAGNDEDGLHVFDRAEVFGFGRRLRT